MERLIIYASFFCLIISCGIRKECLYKNYDSEISGKSFEFIGFKDLATNSIDSVDIDLVKIDIKFLNKKKYSFIGTEEAIYQGRFKDINEDGTLIDYKGQLDEKVSAVYMMESTYKQNIIFEFGEIISKINTLSFKDRLLQMHGENYTGEKKILLFKSK